MNAKKRRDKNRRRARKLAVQAWEAADHYRFDLAVKIIRRAVDLSPGNPVLWNDQGLLLRQSSDEERAAKSFAAAISLSADFAEAYANLAEVLSRQGNTEQAEVLQREAVRHEPGSEQYRQTLRVYEVLARHSSTLDTLSYNSETTSIAEGGRTYHTLRLAFPALASRVESLNWPAIEESLTSRGYAHIQEFVSPQECETLRAMFDDERLFSKTVTMAKRHFGRGVYRYFGAPIPALVDAIRQVVYPFVSRIANGWQRLLNEKVSYPLKWEEFRRQCADAGQTASSPLLLRYETGGFNAFHQDVRGAVFFPLQLVVVVSPRAESSTDGGEGFTGGDFLLADVLHRNSSDCRRIQAGLGDAVIFCTKYRVVRIAGLYGLQSVKHGMDRITSGTRYAAGIPFHEYE